MYDIRSAAGLPSGCVTDTMALDAHGFVMGVTNVPRSILLDLCGKSARILLLAYHRIECLIVDTTTDHHSPHFELVAIR